MKRTFPSPSVSSRRKRESYGNLIEYQEYEELSVRKKREEAAAVVETEEEIALRSYGSRLRYECGPARRFLDDFEQLHYLDRWMECNWNQTWTKTDVLDTCVWVQCLYPPDPPEGNQISLVWDGSPTDFNSSISYRCESDDLYFEWDNLMEEFNVTCLSDGSFDIPKEWPQCLPSVNCTEPPEKPGAGTWEWNGELVYETEILYTCGPYGNFLSEAEGTLYEELVAVCAWNKTWVPSKLDTCAATSCQEIPFPPKDIGLVYTPDEKNNITLASEFSVYNPTLPMVMKFKGVSFCDDNREQMMIVGKIPADSELRPEIIFRGNGTDEAFHFRIDVDAEFVERWANRENTTVGKQGNPGDGTSIDRDEPFVIRISCDTDGWVVKSNKEKDYPTFLHIIQPVEILDIQVLGDVEISYIGFGDDKLQPAPPVGFNLTFMCPEGQVFDHDWFATPFVMLTCQGTGVFDDPPWEGYSCVLPTTTECFDCTTTTTTPPPTTTPGPIVTLAPTEMLYGSTADYYWEQFDKNVTKRNMIGGWKPDTGTVSGLVGFGKALSFEEGQCLVDTKWAKPDPNNTVNGLDPCMSNPVNCTEGLSYSVWELMVWSPDVLEGGGNKKKYVVSTGGDFNSRTGKAWPGVAIYHQGLELVGVVSTGEKVWELRVSGQLYNNTWTQIGLRFSFPDMSNPKWADMGEPGFEKMGGLEMWINAEKVGHAILPQSTDRGSTMWKPLPALTHDGTPEGRPIMMTGCHQNSDMQLTGEFSGFAGSPGNPALFDEVAVWGHRLEKHEILFMLGGYSFDLGDINADQFGAMLGNVDLDDPEQADAAQAVLEAMLMGPPITTPAFPTRTPEPTTTQSTTEQIGNLTAAPTTPPETTMPPVQDSSKLRKTMLGRQDVLSTMLMADNTYNIAEGTDPLEVEGRFAISSVASAILTKSEENKEQWSAVYEEAEHIGPQKTVKQMEEYMLAWVGSVNISAADADTDPEKNGKQRKYFDERDDSMRYATHAEDFVLRVDKLHMSTIRANGAVRRHYPDYSGWEWAEAKAKWENTQDNFSVPTGMFLDVPGCQTNPMNILTSVYNGLPEISAKRRNPVTIKSENFFIDSKVISVRTKMSSDPMVGDVTETYKCEPSAEYMKWNPVKLRLFHRQPAKAKRTLLWHKDDYWSGLEVRHCVWWNERFGTNGAWDTTGCKMTATDEEKSSCECSGIGSYAVLSEMLQAPNLDNSAIWLIAIKWVGIIIGTILLAIFIGVVFVSVVVGEMFHQLRMYCCLAYLIANLLSLVGDTSVCEDRHNNMAISMMLMYFYQAAICWNMCEAHATFKGITAGLINGRTSVYHPIAWGLPLICVGFLCHQYGELLGTHPNCFVSWENVAVEKFFYYNFVIFCCTIAFDLVICLNVVRVQSHNKETVEYLKDQVKGLLLISLLMSILWLPLGWVSYVKNPERNLPNMMPLFQILNGWFGVILFLALGVWSKRFMLGLNAQAEEKKRMMKEKKGGGEVGGDTEPLGSPEDTHSLNSGGGSRPGSAVVAGTEEDPPESEAPPPGSRPATAGATGTSRPTSAAPLSEGDPPQEELPVDEEALP